MVIALWQACGLTREWNDPVQDYGFALAGATSTILVHEIESKIVASVFAFNTNSTFDLCTAS